MTVLFISYTHCTRRFPAVELLPTRVFLPVVSGGISKHSWSAYRRNMHFIFGLFSIEFKLCSDI